MAWFRKFIYWLYNREEKKESSDNEKISNEFNEKELDKLSQANECPVEKIARDKKAS